MSEGGLDRTPYFFSLFSRIPLILELSHTFVSSSRYSAFKNLWPAPKFGHF